MSIWAPRWAPVLFCPGAPGLSVTCMTVFAPPRHRREEQRQHSEHRQTPEGTSGAARRRNGERGLVSVEYLATAFIAAALIGVLVAVPVSTQSTVTNGFKDAVCKIFGMGCEGAGDPGNNGNSAPEAQNPNDAVPACTVSRTSESGNIKGKAGLWELGGGWALQHDTNSEGKHILRLTSSAEGGFGREFKAGKEVKGGKAEMKGKAEAKVNIGFEQGDTWEVDNDAEAAALEKQLRDWTYYNMADDATGGFGGKLFAGLTNGPKPPRDPDAKRYVGELGGKAKAEGNLAFGIQDVAESTVGGTAGAEAGGKFGVETQSNGYFDLLVEGSYGGELGGKADAKAKEPEALPGQQNGAGIPAPPTAKFEAGGAMKRKQLVTYKFNDKHELIGLNVRQSKINGSKFKASGEADYSGGDKGAHKDDNFTVGVGDDNVTEEWYDMNMDFTQMSEEDKNAALNRIRNNPIPINLEDMMQNGPGDGKGENAIYNNSKLAKNVYEVDKDLVEDSFDIGPIGGEAKGEKSGYRLVDSEYAEPVKNGKREIKKNSACLK